MTVDIERVRRVFENDRFATGNGVRILEAAPGHARCELVITDEHRNGMNAVMGGAIYTLADLAFAVASNVGQLATVTLDSSMTFLNGVKGETLYAEAVCEKAGSRTCCFNVTVTDDLGTQVAVCRSTGMRVGKHSLVPVPRYQLAAFDLDGTILSTIEDLAAAVNHALLEAGLPQHTVAEVQSFVGNGFGKLIERSVPEGTPEAVREAVGASFRSYYAEHCMDATHPYDGIEEVFRHLKEAGCKVAVLSNKGNSAVQTIIAHYFPGLVDVAYGEREGIPRKPSPDALMALLAEMGIEKEDAVYIGDSDVDIHTAENAGMDGLVVGWGFREPSFLVSQGASRIIMTMEELESAILG